MAVKVNNTENIRKSKRWNERDDAALCLLIKKKIKDLNVSLRESETPYERSRLKELRVHYKEILHKVEAGVYNGDIIFGEMQAAANLRAQQTFSNEEYKNTKIAKNYVNSYQNMDFDYETAFRKKRYYGIGLPIFMTLLILVYLCVFLMGAFLPADIKATASESGINLNAMFYYKLTETFDIEITNDGVWPSGTYSKTAPVKGVPYEDAAGNAPEKVKLFKDLGMTSIDISAFDIIKAWFHTPMLKNKRIDFLENSPLFKGTSYYYLCFMSDKKMDSLKIVKDENGKFDFSIIIRHIGVYGTIMFLIIAFILGVFSLLFSLVRIFTYTTRKFHILNILCLIFSALAMISPALATIEGTEFGATFGNYFLGLTDFAGFIAEPTAVAGLGIIFLLPCVLALVSLILPKLFRNRLKKRVSYVPKGNRNRKAGLDPYVMNEENLDRMV